MAKTKPRLTRAYRFLFTNKLSDAELQAAYQESQTTKSVVLLAAYAVGNFGFALSSIIPAALLLSRDNYDHRTRYPELKQFYAPLNEDLHLDANYHKLLRDQKYAFAQQIALVVVPLLSMLLLKLTKWYFRVLPYTLALMNMCTIPFWPVINFKMSVMMAMGTVAYTFTGVLFNTDSLAQLVVLVACQLSCLQYRLPFVMPCMAEFSAVSSPV